MAYKTLQELNNTDIVDFLASLGYQPKQIKGSNYWYISMLPGRQEKTPSFKVNRKLNRWTDFGTGAGSTLVDFGILYFNCTIRELVTRLSQPGIENVPRHDSLIQVLDRPKLEIVNTLPLTSSYLIRYLWERRIPQVVAQAYCVEAHYTFGQKPYYAIGFRCDAGGYELRNKYHKYSTQPKSPTLIRHQAKEVAVFEGFFDMLSFVSFISTPISNLPDLLVLNSVAHFEKSLPVLDSYPRKHLFLDNDPAGDKITKTALASNTGYLDHRPLYKGHKDLNAWVCNIGKAIIPEVTNLPAIDHNGP